MLPVSRATMSTTDQLDHSAHPGGVIAAIDIGTNSIRMAVAQVLPDGRVDVLEQLRRAARLGQDTFGQGRLDEEAMRAAVAILRDYRRQLDLYDVRGIRAVATSAIREARNADMFIDRVFMATGFDVEVIETAEESRLKVYAVRHKAGSRVKLSRFRTLVGEVGGGSTELTILSKGHIVASQSLPLGSIRLQEMLVTTHETPERSAEILAQHVDNALTSAGASLKLGKIKKFVAIGGDVRFAAEQVGQPTDEAELVTLDRDRLDELIDRCHHHTPEDLINRFGLNFADAETLVPALLVYQALMHATGLKEMIVSPVTMRDGLLLDLALRVTGQEDETLAVGVMHSAETIAEKYGVDPKHSANVARLALRLFDQLQAEHGLGRRQRLLLQAAAMLHEVGRFIHTRAHHKHGYYIIANTEIFGLSREEREIVALVARYHRRSCPKNSHLEYTALPRPMRMVVCKLAALLRLADALDRGHAQQVRELTCHPGDGELVIRVEGVADLTLERRGLDAKGDLFADIFGLKIRLEEAPASLGDQRRAEAVQ